MIKLFKDEYRFLSNFYRVDVFDEKYTGKKYPSLENAYQAIKTKDPVYWAKLSDQNCSSGKAKRYGREIKLRSDWEEIKLEVMEYLLRQKFKRRDMRAKLLQTGNKRLYEGNFWHDLYWGKEILKNGTLGKGQNHLGRLLMKIRGELQ